MFSGFFGSGSKAPSPANTTNASSNGTFEAQSAPPPPSSAPPTSSGDIFGGMEVTSAKTRRAKARQSMAAGEIPAVASEPSASKEASFAGDESAPLPSGTGGVGRKKRGVTAASSEAWAEIDKKAKIRARLERFYAQYNPSKLDSIDKAMASYEGREGEMFEALVKKYGPEPPVPSGEFSNKNEMGSPPTSTSPISAQPTGFGETSGGGGWGDNGGTVAEGASGGGGWGDSSSGAALGGWGDAAATNSVVADSWGAATGGSTGFAFGGAATTESASNGFDFSGGGFGDAPATTSGTTGWGGTGFGDEAGTGGGFGVTTDAATGDFGNNVSEPAPVAEVAKPEEDTIKPPENAATSETSSDDEETMNERHRRELKAAKEAIHVAIKQASGEVKAITDVIAERRRLVTLYNQTESDIEVCIQQEDYEKADQLNATLASIAKSVQSKDGEESLSIKNAEFHHQTLVESLKSLAAVYKRQREELKDNQKEEERRTTTYLIEMSSKLEQQGDRIRADLERATRQLNHSDQELANLLQRQSKVKDKMNEQTKGLRANRDKAANSQKELESEIAKLEATLAQKRRSLAEVKIEVGTVTEKIRLVEEEFTGTLTEVEKLINEEQSRKAAHQVTVDGLTTQESQMLRDEADFRDEKASMTFQLRTYDARIKCYGTLAAYLEGDKAKTLQDYYAKSVGVALDGRKKGRHILAPSVNSSEASPDTTAAASNPATALRQKESQLRSTELRAASLESELSELQLQIQDIDKKVPILENAKKAAAAAKQFKEAAAKTAEVKQLQEDKAAKSEAVSKVQDEQKEVASAIEKLKTEVDSERRRAEEAVGIFTQSYAKILGEAISSAEVRAPLLSFLTNVVELDESAAAGTLEGGDALSGSKSSNSSFGNSQTANNDDERSSADAEVAVSLLLDDTAHHTTANEPIAATAIALLGNLKAELLSASASVDKSLNDAIEAAAKQIGKEMAVIAETRAQLFKDFKEKKANGSASASPDTEESAKETTREAHPASNSESLKQPAAEPEEVSEPPQPVAEIPEPTVEAAGEAGLSPVGSTTSSKRSKRAKADAFALMPDEQTTEQQPVEENGNAGWGSATSGNFGHSGWGSENADQTTTAGGGWDSSEAAGGWGATTDAETTEAFSAPEPIVDSRATIEAQISEIEAQLNAAMEAEDYEQCDALQTQIDELKSKLA